MTFNIATLRADTTVLIKTASDVLRPFHSGFVQANDLDRLRDVIARVAKARAEAERWTGTARVGFASMSTIIAATGQAGPAITPLLEIENMTAAVVDDLTQLAATLRGLQDFLEALIASAKPLENAP